MNRRVTPLSK
jgi:hypothetical protein